MAKVPGSGLSPDGMGFMFQDRGELFHLTDGHPNVYAPRKRPFQTIIPGFATRDGQPWLAFGVMGGDMQPQGQAQIVINMVDYGLDLQAAGDSPRWHHEGSSEPTGEPQQGVGLLRLETGVPDETERKLAALGWKRGPPDGGRPEKGKDAGKGSLRRRLRRSDPEPAQEFVHNSAFPPLTETLRSL